MISVKKNKKQKNQFFNLETTLPVFCSSLAYHAVRSRNRMVYSSVLFISLSKIQKTPLIFHSYFNCSLQIDFNAKSAFTYLGYQRFFFAAEGNIFTAEGRNKDLTKTGNRAWKVSSAQGSINKTAELKLCWVSLHSFRFRFTNLYSVTLDTLARSALFDWELLDTYLW